MLDKIRHKLNCLLADAYFFNICNPAATNVAKNNYNNVIEQQ